MAAHPPPARGATPVHRALAWAALAAGAAALAVATACVAFLAFLWWRGPLPDVAPGEPAPGNDTYGLGIVAGFALGWIALALGSGLLYVGRRLRGAPAFTRLP